MYTIDDKDRVTALAGLPQSATGAPNPLVIADGLTVVVAYYIEDTPRDWDGRTGILIGMETEGHPVALVRFEICRAHLFGPPNDEAFDGHPLAARGLEPYGAFEVHDSSWIRTLERMNSVHSCHRPEHYADLRHLVLTFHDETFECVCRGFTVEVRNGSIASLVPAMIGLLRW